ncbi:MAG TPA: vanadium-dependent haloperoxidase [Candidatus Acidoferrum sp.]|nr:vanadium-dependent haloperoxidase [Candidatus Acidoferrum sp.]
MVIRWFVVVAIATAALTLGAGAGRAVTLPPGNAAQQWDKIAEDTVVGGGALQPEAFIYLGYVSAAMDRVVNPGVRNGQNADAAVAQAAYDVLVHYFPAQAANLSALHDAALAAVPDGPAKRNGIMYGDLAAAGVLRERADDGLTTPIGTTSPYTPLDPAAGVWRRTPPAFAPAQTPWMGDVRPFILDSADRFMPPPPPSLQSQEWVDAFNEVKSVGAANSLTRTPEQTATAQFYAANVPRQFNLLARTIATNENLDVPQTARLLAMINEVGADALISMMHAKYHFQFWRPVTAIDPGSVTNDGLGPVPGLDDGNPLTVEQPGWRPLLATPNHPEYPSAHCTITSAIGEVIARFIGTDAINIDLVGNANFGVTRHFATVQDLRTEVGNARVWAGLHYRFSTVAGLQLGKEVADYDLDHAFNTGG